MVEHMSPGILGNVGGRPRIDFYWKEVSGKRRLIGNPNTPMRILHQLFGKQIMDGVMSTGDNGYGVRNLPSATGCVEDSNPTLNAKRHSKGKFFYITDLRDAYSSVDLERLALLLVFLDQYRQFDETISLKFFAEDGEKDKLRALPVYREMRSFLQCHFAGIHGKGIAVGGPLSPYLMNLYCEVYLDARVRYWCERRNIVYTRYVDDLVFSREVLISSVERKEIRQFVAVAGFTVNHRKSKVLALSQGTVFVTKVGLAAQPDAPVARLVFPQKKRRRLRNAILNYLTHQMDWPEHVSGLVAEFLYYYKNVPEKTSTDRKTFALCRAFESEWAKWRKGPVPWEKKKNI